MDFLSQFHSQSMNPLLPSVPVLVALTWDYTYITHSLRSNSSLIKNWPPQKENSNIDAGPKIMKDKWPLQVERFLSKKRETLLTTSIYHAINFSQYQIESDSDLIPSALSFWNPIFNHFQFRFGPISPTVLDICYILGFSPIERILTHI